MSAIRSSFGASDRARRRVAWAAPVVIAGVVVAGVALSGGSASGSTPNLPARTAAQLIAAVQSSDATALSGIVRESAHLGIPDLPGQGSSASLSWQTFVSGSHSAKVWVDGPDRQRVALIGELSEAEVVHNGTNVWTYTSDTNTVTHTVLKDHPGKDVGHAARPDTSTTQMTPAAVAAKVLDAITPSTVVSVHTSRMVANRPAYTLVLKPRASQSTVKQVNIAIDAAKSVPLRVQVVGDGGAVAFEIGFTKVSFATPSPATFNFRAPAGAVTSADPLGAQDRFGGRHHDGDRPATRPATQPATASSAHPSPKMIGAGWTTVLAVPSGSANALGGRMLDELTSSVGNSGDRLLHTALVNALIRADGTTFVGAVTPAFLEHVAATTPH